MEGITHEFEGVEGITHEFEGVEGITHEFEGVEVVVDEERGVRPEVLLLQPLQHLRGRQTLGVRGVGATVWLSWRGEQRKFFPLWSNQRQSSHGICLD